MDSFLLKFDFECIIYTKFNTTIFISVQYQEPKRYNPHYFELHL